MHTAIIERMSRYTRWFRHYKAAKGYSALQELADKIDLSGYYGKPVAKTIRTSRIINYELELWGSVNKQTNSGETALHNAARYNAVEALKVLLTRPEIDVNIQDKYGWTALYYAARRNAVESLKVLLPRPEIDVNIREYREGETVLHVAARDNAVESLKVLLTRPEIEVNIQNKYGWTALHVAACNNAVEALKVLITRPDIEANIQNNFGCTALHLAARKNAVESVKVLVNFGVDKSIKDNNGKLALRSDDRTTNSEIREILKPKS